MIDGWENAALLLAHRRKVQQRKGSRKKELQMSGAEISLIPVGSELHAAKRHILSWDSHWLEDLSPVWHKGFICFQFSVDITLHNLIEVSTTDSPVWPTEQTEMRTSSRSGLNPENSPKLLCRQLLHGYRLDYISGEAGGCLSTRLSREVQRSWRERRGIKAYVSRVVWKGQTSVTSVSFCLWGLWRWQTVNTNKNPL